MNGQLTCALADGAQPWSSIDWNEAHAAIRRMQARIVKAVQDGRWNKVRALQRLLTTSFYGKALAVKRVTENKGKRTPGVDGKLWSTPRAKMAAIKTLRRKGYRPMPLRRIYIPKSNGKLRPLSIPTMQDRAMQALHLLALDPVSETISDEQSYGFRKERSTHDAIGQCYVNARFRGDPSDGMGGRLSAQWILEADIRGCFDNIDHAWLLRHVPMDKIILRKWLQAGYLEGDTLTSTTQGTPQGGIISPVLANFALNGLEGALAALSPTQRQRRANKVNLVRYADDFVITGENRELLEQTIVPAVRAFLAQRGLELSPEKTKITHLTEGYDFLGQNVRRYGRKLLIKPAAKNVKAFLNKIRDLIRRLRAATPSKLLLAINPVIAGWAEYHRHIVAQETFQYVDRHIWYAIWQWAKRRHPNKPPRWVFQRYFHRFSLRQWVFAVDTRSQDAYGNPIFHVLRRAASTPIERHTKISADANPYDRAWYDYFAKRDVARKRASKRPRTALGAVSYVGRYA